MSWYLGNGGKYTKENSSQFKVGSLVVLHLYCQNKLPEYMWVQILDKNDEYYTGVFIHKAHKISIKSGEEVRFTEENIVKTIKSRRKLEHPNIYFNTVVRVSKKAFEQKEFNVFQRINISKEYNFGWLLSIGNEGEKYIQNKNNFMMVPLIWVISIDKSVLKFIKNEMHPVYLRNEKGKFKPLF